MLSTDRIDPGRPGANDVPVLPLGTDQHTDILDPTADLAYLMTIDPKTASTFAVQLQRFGKELGEAAPEALEAIGERTARSIHGLLLQVDVLVREKKITAERALHDARESLAALQAKPAPVAAEGVSIEDVLAARQRSAEAAQQQVTSNELRVSQTLAFEAGWNSARLGLLAYIAKRTQAAIARMAPQVLETAVA